MILETEKKLFLLDIDGTICIGAEWIPGAKEFLSEIRESGAEFVFITNNTTRGVSEYITWFQQQGVPTDPSNYMTASMVTTRYMKEQRREELYYVLGTPALIRELKRQGIPVTTNAADSRITTVCISYDNTLTYDKLTDVCRLLTNPNISYIATNQDLTCPIEFGYVPDCGSICQMVGNATNRIPRYLGKPGKSMIEYALQEHQCEKEDAIIVGDRLYTDIASGNRSNVDTVLVLTGESKVGDIVNSEHKPTFILNSIREIRNKNVKSQIIA
ncbi:hypothetical NagD-like phosphatase [Lachnospiraceae bacterium KM106-2]|nr:hypothetical NagD-like phosphatase [Lachnospiraceae bacterium KM106-2]